MIPVRTSEIDVAVRQIRVIDGHGSWETVEVDGASVQICGRCHRRAADIYAEEPKRTCTGFIA